MIGNDIINRIGGGSGINTGSLVNDLVEINDAPETERLDKREALLQAQISDYGMLRSALSSLESAVAAVSNKDTFDAKAVSVPNTSLISLAKLEAKATAGEYRLQIEQTAQSHALSSGAFLSQDATIGQGEIMLRFGNWDATQDDFTVNPNRAGASIVIDESNNTLKGLRDAINGANIGVQASIISDGTGFRLLLTAPSGEKNELELTVVEDGSYPGLSAFAFNESEQQLSQQQEGRDALVRVNGLLVARESNRVTDVIEGLEFDIFNSSPSEVINITISADKATAEQVIRDFVEAYNTFFREVDKLVGFDSELDDFGSLRNDSLAKNLMQRVRSFLGSNVSGLDSGFSNLATLGIRTRRDGTLEINENPNEPNTNFQAAINNHFEQVRDFFVPSTKSDNSSVSVNSFSSRTQAGVYDIEITQQATKGRYIADPMTEGFPLDTTGKDYSFIVRVDGHNSATITLPEGKVYQSAQELATDIQVLINLDNNLRNARVGVSVSFDQNTGALGIYSNDYGSETRVSIMSVGADMDDLGITVRNGVVGDNVIGTINGEQAFGLGNVLLPPLNSPGEGLSLTIGPGVTSARVEFSRGFAGGLISMINTFKSSNGLISEREKNIRNDISKVEDDRVSLARRSDAYRARLQSQFMAMEMIVRSLNNTGNFLDGILDRLPFTASKK